MLVYQIYQLIIWDIIMPTVIPINFPCATLFQVVLVLYQQLLPCMPDFSGCFQGINAAAQPKKKGQKRRIKDPGIPHQPRLFDGWCGSAATFFRGWFCTVMALYQLYQF